MHTPGMHTLSAPVAAETQPDSRWFARTQDAAIFAACANLFSPALANVGLVVFLLLFLGILLGPERRRLAWSTFPRGVALAIALYIGWEAIGMLYTDAPISYAWRSFYDDRKILYILPLALLFGREASRRRFLAAFLAVNVVGLLLSFVLVLPRAQNMFHRLPLAVLHSHVTQGMAFALAFFLSLWYASQSVDRRWRACFIVLALAFLLNIVVVTVGRSGYAVFLVLVVMAFGFWRGPRGVAIGLVAAAVIGIACFYASSTVRSRVLLGVNEATNYATAPEESSLGRRMLLYHVTLELIAQHPLLGTGTGSFKGHFSNLVAQRYSDWKAAPFHDPHNQYLFVLVESRAVGLALFLFLLVSLYRASDKSTIYGQMAAASLLAWSVTSLFSGHFRTFIEGHMIVFVLGILMTRLQPVAAPSGVRTLA